MRRSVFFTFLVFVSLLLSSQNSFTISPASLFYGIGMNDSVIIYQCMVVDAGGNSPGDRAARAAYSLTDKVVLKRNEQGFYAVIYSTHIRDLPNRKFSGLKIRERPYWHFEKTETIPVGEDKIENLARFENLGRDAMEYDYAVSRYTRNQVIIKRGKNFRQLVYSKPLKAAALVR